MALIYYDINISHYYFPTPLCNTGHHNNNTVPVLIMCRTVPVLIMCRNILLFYIDHLSPYGHMPSAAVNTISHLVVAHGTIRVHCGSW